MIGWYKCKLSQIWISVKIFYWKLYLTLNYWFGNDNSLHIFIINTMQIIITPANLWYTGLDIVSRYILSTDHITLLIWIFAIFVMNNCDIITILLGIIVIRYCKYLWSFVWIFMIILQIVTIISWNFTINIANINCNYHEYS